MSHGPFVDKLLSQNRQICLNFVGLRGESISLSASTTASENIVVSVS